MPTPIISPASPGRQRAQTLPPARFTQARRLLELTTPLGPDHLLAETLDAAEHIGAGGYRLELSVLSRDAHIDLSKLVGKPARLRLRTALPAGPTRAWHGHITAARFEAANGGFARYRLRIEPWLAFLRGRRDSFAFNDMTVFDIVERVFADYRGRGALAPSWLWRVADRAVYPRRSLTTQYQESDFAFVDRLLAEEGLFYWFEHEDADDASLGRHTLVIADHNDAFGQDPQGKVRFHRPDVTEPEDTIESWREACGWQTQALIWSSWDYRGMGTRPVMAETRRGDTDDAVSAVDADYAGQYAYEDTRQGERLARNAAAARRVREALHEGEGTVRTLAAGSTFTLLGGDVPPGRPLGCYAVMAIRHQARNNFDESTGRAVREALGPGEGRTDAVSFYRNRFHAFRTSLDYRPANRDEYGARLLPKPTVPGPQTAVVVGRGDAIHTDRDHRIKVQFHWQRGRVASSRSAHPSGEDNAPGSAQTGTWVRVAEALAGPDWGACFLPRVGQEVLVEFMHGDIDRPVVVGCLFNGAGAADAQYNRIQSAAANATGNAPAWFAGQRAGHGHNAVLSGVKTQALGASAKGTGGHSRLVFDDTPGEPRLELSTTQAQTRLQLGHLKQQRDNERLADLGHGAELASQAAVSVRAGEGMLITADAQPEGKGEMLDSRPATQALRQSQESVRRLAESAGTHKAVSRADEAASALPALEALRHLAAVLGSTRAVGDEGSWRTPTANPHGKAPAMPGGGSGCVTAYGESHMQFSAPAGIAQYTPAASNIVAGGTMVQAARDIDWSVGRTLHLGAAHGLVLYARGAASGGDAAASRPGLRLHAAHGKASIASLDARLDLHAQRNVTVASCDADVTIRADQGVLLTAGGAYLRVQGGGIQLHGPGKVELRAAQHRWQGPARVSMDGELPEGGALCEAALQGATREGGASVPIGR